MIKRTKTFVKHFKKVVQNKKYHSILSKKIQLDEFYGTRFEIVMECFSNHCALPAYFVAHTLNISHQERQILAKIFHVNVKNIHQLELHLNGATGDLLIIYAQDSEDTLLIDIGTHAQLFK